MLPVYYNNTKLTPNEVELAKKSWEYISSDKAPVYLQKLENNSFTKNYSTCVDWFIDIFYERLFDIHPVSSHYFYFIMRMKYY